MYRALQQILLVNNRQFNSSTEQFSNPPLALGPLRMHFANCPDVTLQINTKSHIIIFMTQIS